MAAKKGNGGGSNGVNVNGILNGLLKKFGLGGYTTNPPGRDQAGTWLPMGEPGGMGGTVQQNGIMWPNNGSVQGGNLGALTTSIMIESPRQTLGNNAAPLFQRLTLKAMDGQIGAGVITPAKGGVFSNAADTTCLITIGIGVYMARFNPDTNLYGVQDPLSAADVSRFDWIYLEARMIPYVLDASQQVFYPSQGTLAPKIWDLTHPDFNQVLGPGEALMLSMNSAFGPNSPVPNPAVTPNQTVLGLDVALRAFMVRGS